VENIRRPNRWYFSLRMRLALIFSILAIAAIGITILVLYLNFSQMIREDLRQRIISIVAVAALQQNGDEFASITSEKDPLYEKFRLQNLKIRRSDPEIAYIFTISKDAKGLYFVVDAGDPGETNIARFGERYTDPSETLKDNYDTMQSALADPGIYTDIYGKFLSAYAPIFNKQGDRVGAIGVDLLADTVVAKEQEFLTISLIVFLVSLFLVAVAGWFFGNTIARPINDLASSANKIAAGDFSRRVEVKTTTTEIAELAYDFNIMTNSLNELVQDLENRVEERTRTLQQRTDELVTVSSKMERRATQFSAVALVARAISSVQKLEDLLPRIATVVSEEFQFYHVGIFLLDEPREYAVLAASNSSGGQRMLERGHKLRVGQVGIVGFVAGTGQARIALDTGTDAVYFNNPDLSETHSEMALPLLIRDVVIGILDVQSIKTNAFDEEDIELLGIVADQVSIAIQNANQFQAAQKAYEEAEAANKKYIRQEWRSLVREQRRLGYRFSTAGVGPLKAPNQSPEIEEATSTGQTQVVEADNRSQLVIPIRLRGQLIGMLNVQAEGKRIWDQDEIDITEAAAERVALAMENARLVDASQAQASRERTISEITSRIGASVNLRNMLQTAVEELGRILPGSDVVVQLESKE
jgi:GAF domain-containing protein/HAMP domain-containing protein